MGVGKQEIIYLFKGRLPCLHLFPDLRCQIAEGMSFCSVDAVQQQGRAVIFQQQACIANQRYAKGVVHQLLLCTLIYKTLSYHLTKSSLIHSLFIDTKKVNPSAGAKLQFRHFWYVGRTIFIYFFTIFSELSIFCTMGLCFLCEFSPHWLPLTRCPYTKQLKAFSFYDKIFNKESSLIYIILYYKGVHRYEIQLCAS